MCSVGWTTSRVLFAPVWSKVRVKSTNQSQLNQRQMLFTPTKLRHVPVRHVLAASVGVYGRAINTELSCPKPDPVHVENMCTTYNQHMRLLHSLTLYENKLKADNMDID